MKEEATCHSSGEKKVKYRQQFPLYVLIRLLTINL